MTDPVVHLRVMSDKFYIVKTACGKTIPLSSRYSDWSYGEDNVTCPVCLRIVQENSVEKESDNA